MKIIFRILLILVVASLIGGLMYAGVNASGSSSVQTSFEGERPLPPDSEEFRPDGERDEGGGFEFPFGVVKSLVLMSIAGGVYSVIVSAGKKGKRAVAA